MRDGWAVRRAGVAFVTAASLLTGCGTLTHGSTQRVQIESTPPGARVRIEPGGQTVTTPGRVTLERDRDYALEFTLAGYQPRSRSLEKRYASATLLGNLLLTASLGMIVDARNGSSHTLVPSPLHVTLDPLPFTGPPATHPRYCSQDRTGIAPASLGRRAAGEHCVLVEFALRRGDGPGRTKPRKWVREARVVCAHPNPALILSDATLPGLVRDELHRQQLSLDVRPEPYRLWLPVGAGRSAPSCP